MIGKRLLKSKLLWLFLGITLLCVGAFSLFGWIRRENEKARFGNRVVNDLETLGCYVVWDRESDKSRNALTRSILGDDRYTSTSSIIASLGDVTDASVAQLGCFPELTSLLLGESASDKGLLQLRCQQSLEELRLKGPGFTDAGIRNLSGYQHLRDLALENTRISHNGIRQLISLKLQSIALSGPNIGDKELLVISQINTLEELKLHDTRITSNGLAALSGAKSLSRLTMSNNRYIQSDAIDALQTGKPQLTIRSILNGRGD